MPRLPQCDCERINTRKRRLPYNFGRSERYAVIRVLILCLTCLILTTSVRSQTPLSRDEALKQLYRDYDPSTKTARWICTKGQQQEQHEGWPCSEEYAKVVVTVELSTQVVEHGTEKTYLIASTIPFGNPHDFECHSCAPAIGVAVFAWRGMRWELESANAAVGWFGEWGGAATSQLVAIGPEQHGVILESEFSGQGYHESVKYLLVPLGSNVNEVWKLFDEQDDSGAFDPNDKSGQHRLYYAEVAFKFVYVGKGDYYDILAMSRGTDDKGRANWTKQYRFSDGQYRLLHTTTYSEAKVPQKSGSPKSTSLK